MQALSKVSNCEMHNYYEYIKSEPTIYLDYNCLFII